MADDTSDKRPAPTPKKPSKRPTRDYSALPQRPITLKGKNKRKNAQAHPRETVKDKPAATRKKSPPKATKTDKTRAAQAWSLKKISAEAKQIAQEGADLQGITVDEWLEQLIMASQRPAPPPPQPSDEQLSNALRAIEQRLDRLEEQRGFWNRFWDQVMKQQ
ncbi:MAG: hypothetical protein KZQ99_15135 [Candidatus Thiodiazotropha sp. (ex Dulcina madagascariensis)]|nr:hypothetical protein [Candidatus Thiodiazotropha sp. (ex Dulcina madagascariensis)]